MADLDVELDGRSIRVASVDRVLWPATGTTKGDLLAYVLHAADALLAHVRGRPLTLHRFPEGVTGRHFFQTRCPPHPEWIRTQRMWTFRAQTEVDAPVLDDRAGLAWAVHLSAIELHPFLACADDLAHPGAVVFDLDPGPPAGPADACAIALVVRAVLDGLGLASYPKSSGGAGVHVVVPVAAGTTFAETKAFARAVAGLLARDQPDRVVDRMARSERAGRVFIDWGQNDAGKTTVAPWSVRGEWVPTVAAPLEWAEVERAAAGHDHRAAVVTLAEARARLDRHGDRHAPVLAGGPPLPALPPAPALAPSPPPAAHRRRRSSGPAGLGG
jgi:bifunctional non-homologous end joining protein LigD